MLKSIACPECHNTLWDIEWNHVDDTRNAVCSNCLYRRVFKKRSPGSGISPSQKKSIKDIKRYFGKHLENDFHEFRVTEIDNGVLSISISTTGEWYSDIRCHLLVGRRGGKKITYYAHGISGKDYNSEMAKYAARGIKAQIKKDIHG